MRKIYALLITVVLFAGAKVNGQVTITNPANTTPAMSATYGSLALAITDVNNRTAISGPVTITLDPATPQTAPAGGYSITANTVTCAGLSATNNGNHRARTTAIELAWLWLTHQPDSELSRWFRERVGNLKGRIRKIAIVALARKLMVALWRYLETGLVPTGATMRPSL